MVARRYAPDRTVYLAYGHDEEVGGTFGATAIARLLESRGVQLEFVLDEGGIVVLDGVPPFVAAPVGIIGTAEKVAHPSPSLRVKYTAGAKMPDYDGSVYALGLFLDGGPLPLAWRTLSDATGHSKFRAPSVAGADTPVSEPCAAELLDAHSAPRSQIASMVGRLFAALDRWPTPLTLVELMPDFFVAVASGVKYRGLAWLLRHAKHPCARLLRS